MDKLYANYRIRIIKNRVKYITRTFPVKSEVKVQPKQEVTPDEIVAEGMMLPGFRSINLASLLQVPAGQAQKYLQRQIGQRIFKGELLAFRQPSLLQPKKVIISPTDGVLERLDEKTGELRMSFIPKTINTPAAVFGIVEEVKAGKIIIKTEVAEIFGIFGSGKVREGILHIVGRRGNLTRANQINKENSGNVLVSGGLVYKEAISAAITHGAHGLITGGINAKDYLGVSGGQLKFPRIQNTDVGVSIVVCEGFGSIPLGQDIFDTLEQFNGKFVIVDGNQAKIILPSSDQSCMQRIRKTALQTNKYLVEPLNQLEAEALNVGQLARIIVPPFAGEQGRVISIDKSPTTLASKVITYQLTLETLTRKIKVPHPNVEILDS